jgi:hypothetical protein
MRLEDNGLLMTYEWDPEILEALAAVGVRPSSTTSPAPVKDFVTRLYGYELRRLRGCLLRREIPKPTYAGRVAALRPRYWMLSRPAADWARPRP